jgi:hypothetical protein
MEVRNNKDDIIREMGNKELGQPRMCHLCHYGDNGKCAKGVSEEDILRRDRNGLCQDAASIDPLSLERIYAGYWLGLKRLNGRWNWDKRIPKNSDAIKLDTKIKRRIRNKHHGKG